jgi:sulfatase maturation enzyme AslB (radical SAM superfamily)
MNKIDYLPKKTESYNDILSKLYSDKINENFKVRTITFQVTEDCCMACTYCYQHNKTKNKMTFEIAKKFIDDLLNDKYDNINTLNTFTVIFDFIGGEPFLEIDLIE